MVWDRKVFGGRIGIQTYPNHSWHARNASPAPERGPRWRRYGDDEDAYEEARWAAKFKGKEESCARTGRAGATARGTSVAHDFVTK